MLRLSHFVILFLLALPGGVWLGHVVAPNSASGVGRQTGSANSLTNSTLASLVASVESSEAYRVAENGTSYSYASYAGFGHAYSNGTSTSPEVILYFNHYSPAAHPPNCRPIILSQLQVVASWSGKVITVTSISNPVVLNMAHPAPNSVTVPYCH